MKRLMTICVVALVFLVQTTSPTAAHASSGAMGMKQSVLNTLILVRAFATEKADISRLDDAIEKLTEALEPSLWIDDSHLYPETGGSVFDDEKKVIQKLQGIIKNKKGTVPDEVAYDLINTLLGADRLLASVAIAEGNASRHLDKANELLAKGDENWSEGKYANAASNYKKAWKQAINSVSGKLVAQTDAELLESEIGVGPVDYALAPAYPNPFNPSTTIRYEVPEESQVTLRVYDMAGREVATLVNEQKAAGSYEARFDAHNLASGTYFYNMTAGGFTQTRRLILLK